MPRHHIAVRDSPVMGKPSEDALTQDRTNEHPEYIAAELAVIRDAIAQRNRKREYPLTGGHLGH